MSASMHWDRGSRLVLAGVLFAAAVPARPQQPSPSAKDLAQRVDRHYNQLHSLQAGFTETFEGLGMNRTESGTLLLLKPGRMKWNYTSPPGKIFLIDGNYAWSYIQGDSQVQRVSTKELDDLRSPLRFLLGRTKLEKELESLKLDTGPGDRFTLTGVPEGLEKRVERVTLIVTADGAINSMEIEETDGALTRFIFTGERPNAPIPAQDFRFTPPPGVPVVNMLPPV
jgi:outer membrane lipoprotein carrier protein